MFIPALDGTWIKQKLQKALSDIMAKVSSRVLHRWYLKPIAINRGRPREALKQALDEGSDRLNKGLFVLFFPEGTRVEAGQINRYSRSSFELALRSNVPVLPIVHNSGDCWPAHKFLKYPGTIFLTIGKPRKVVDAKESAREVESWARTSLKRSLNI